jgi:cell fate regulator YaaT (PSP1 superfamily)
VVSPEPEKQAPTKLWSPAEALFLTSARDDPALLAEDEPAYEGRKGEKVFNLVTVHFPHGGGVEEFDSGEQIHKRGAQVIVETEKGLQLGVVSIASRLVLRTTDRFPRVIRGMNENDLRQEQRNLGKEEEAWSLCKKLAQEYRLSMKLIAVDYLHGGNRAVFYFSAEGRVDFRQLVRDLASELHTRIEMRQVGVRDASRYLGGIGPCGQCLCCSAFLQRFAPVSIRMAKDQNLVLNPQKVSGVCGRLMCCLTYEQKGYESLRKGLPKPGKRLSLLTGEIVRVRDVDVLQRQIRVVCEDGSNKVVTLEEIDSSAPPKPRPPDA